MPATKTKEKTFEFFSDPGHGWLKVDIAFLRRSVGPLWRSMFTPYSHERGCYVYLEEDCDYARFMKIMDANGYTINIKDRPPANNQSRIRSYSPLMVTQIQQGFK